MAQGQHQCRHRPPRRGLEGQEDRFAIPTLCLRNGAQMGLSARSAVMLHVCAGTMRQGRPLRRQCPEGQEKCFAIRTLCLRSCAQIRLSARSVVMERVCALADGACFEDRDLQLPPGGLAG